MLGCDGGRHGKHKHGADPGCQESCGQPQPPRETSNAHADLTPLLLTGPRPAPVVAGRPVSPPANTEQVAGRQIRDKRSKIDTGPARCVIMAGTAPAKTATTVPAGCRKGRRTAGRQRPGQPSRSPPTGSPVGLAAGPATCPARRTRRASMPGAASTAEPTAQAAIT